MIYIRHSEKLYKNCENTEFSLDPGLTDNGKIQAVIKFNDLLKYGTPDVIYCSPYLRTRETALIAQCCIKQKTNIDVNIMVDILLGEYLGNQIDVNLDTSLHQETLIYQPLKPEKSDEYTNRIKKHIELNKIINKKQDKMIWYISHGIVIQSIAYFSGTKIKYPSPLSGFIKKNNIISQII